MINDTENKHSWLWMVIRKKLVITYHIFQWPWARRCQDKFTAPRHASCWAEKQSDFFFFYYYYNLHAAERLRNPGLSFPSRKTQTSTCQALRQRGRTWWSHPAARAPGFPPTSPLLPPAWNTGGTARWPVGTPRQAECSEGSARVLGHAVATPGGIRSDISEPLRKAKAREMSFIMQVPRPLIPQGCCSFREKCSKPESLKFPLPCIWLFPVDL